MSIDSPTPPAPTDSEAGAHAAYMAGTVNPPLDRQPGPARTGPARSYFARIHTQAKDDPSPTWSQWEEIMGADEHEVAGRIYSTLERGDWVQFGVQVAIAVRGGTVVHLSSGAASNG